MRREEPGLFDRGMEERSGRDAEGCGRLRDGVCGRCAEPRSRRAVSSGLREYLRYVADRRLEVAGDCAGVWLENPFGFMELQDVQELTNFFERRVSAYQVAVKGEVAFHDDF